MRPRPNSAGAVGDNDRPWPAPTRAWVGAQTLGRPALCALANPHCGYAPGEFPADLPLDTYDGQAWVGIVPFMLRGLRLRGQPLVSGLSFLEVNVRTHA